MKRYRITKEEVAKSNESYYQFVGESDDYNEVMAAAYLICRINTEDFRIRIHSHTPKGVKVIFVATGLQGRR